MRAIIEHVDSQLLQSNLSDSMLEGTGFPPNIAELDNYTLQGPPILVEIVAMTEIGHSAFSLQNIRQARIERADLAGLAYRTSPFVMTIDLHEPFVPYLALFCLAGLA